MEHYFGDAKGAYEYNQRSVANVKTHNTAFEHPKRRGSTSAHDSTSDTPKFNAVILPNLPNQKAFIFATISTILRAHVPLAWLSNLNVHCPQSGTLLQAEIPGITRWDYQICIAKQISSNTLYAFERVDTGIYLCHPLHYWVKPHWIEQAAIGAAPLVSLDLLLKSQRENGHSRKPSTASITSAADSPSTTGGDKRPQNRRGHLARLSILDLKTEPEEAQNTIDVRIGDSNLLQLGEHTVHATPENGTHSVPAALSSSRSAFQTPPMSTSDSNAIPDVVPEKGGNVIDHLSTEHLRRQYLETLYLSKTSLAFYSKGPLSRARARARDPGGSRSLEGLVEFYLASIIPTRKLDLKYRESIQCEITRAASTEDGIEDRQTLPLRKKQRTKIGANGLWPMEIEYIGRWWKEQQVIGGPTNTTNRASEEMKKSVAQLRMRETEMQIILILEILALAAQGNTIHDWVGGTKPSNIKVGCAELDASIAPSIVPTAKKTRDLKNELDFLVDRLCIWHSIGMEDTVGIPKESADSGASSEKLKDRLRDFCKDVIVPFYGAKLPDECHIICTNMGGPELSPRRSRNAREKDATRSMPGSAVVSELPTKKRDLHRVLSEDHDGRHFSPPMISRSATLPASVSGKRDSSERPMSRSGMHKSVSFSNREVDLVADAKMTATKRRKLDLVAAQKRELDAAIETLKRPNRSVVAKSIADEVEQRTLENRNPPRKTEPVQISATPRRGKTRQFQMDDYDLPALPVNAAAQEETFIPSSTGKPRGLSHISVSISRSSAKKRAVLSAIHDTPSRATKERRPPSLRHEDSLADDTVGEDKVSSSTLIASTPAISRIREDLLSDGVAATPMRMNRSLRPVTLTPLKRSEVTIEQVFRDAPEIPERAGKTMDRVMGSKTNPAEMSLYECLGWNDDYEL